MVRPRAFVYSVVLAALITALTFSPFSFAATTGVQIEFLLSQVRNATGSLAGGHVYFYSAGTTTNKTVYLDINKVSQAANPYTLDANGTALLYGDGTYRIVIKTAAGVTVYDRDNLKFEDLATDFINSEYTMTIKPLNVTGNSGGAISGYTIGASGYTDNTRVNYADINYARFSNGPWIDVTHPTYGADPTGVSDSTAAIQAALNALGNGKTLLFPPGKYKISSGLTKQNGDGWKITGTGAAGGAGGTVIFWTGNGSAGGTLLDLAGSRNVSVENIMFLGTDHWGFLAYSDTEANLKAGTYKTGIGTYIKEGTQNSTNVTFRNCGWHFFTTGVQIGNTSTEDQNNENNTFYNVSFSYNTTGFKQYWPNAINTQFHGAYFTFNTTDMSFGDGTLQTGSITMIGYNTSHSDTNIYFNNPVDMFALINSRSEHAGKFMDVNAANVGAIPASVTLINTLIYNDSSISQNPFFKFIGNNILAINSSFGTWAESPMNSWVFPTGGTTATFIQCNFNGSYVNGWGDNTTTFPGAVKINMTGSRYWDGTAYRVLADRSYWSLNSTQNVPLGYSFGDNTVTRLNVYGTDYIYNSSSGATVAGLDNGYLGQRTTVVCDGSVTFTNSAYLRLNGSTDFTCDNSSTLTLINQGVYWVEVGRSTR